MFIRITALAGFIFAQSFGLSLIGAPIEAASETAVPQVVTIPELSPSVDEPVDLDPVGSGLLPVRLSELLVDPVAPLSDAADEFVELYNPNTEPVDVSGYVLSTKNDRFVLPETLIEADGYVVVTSAQSKLALVNAGGAVELSDTAGNVVDDTAWVTAPAGSTWAHTADGWRWSTKATPGEANVIPVSAVKGPVTVDKPASPNPANDRVSEDSFVGIAPVISEVLPDPVAPATDAVDEYVELHNAGAVPFNLAGFTLKSGTKLTDHYTFGQLIIEAGEYLALPASLTHLGLTNSGSSVALFDPAGNQVGQTVSYTAAKPGQAWVLDGEAWAWSTTPTPGSQNIVSQPVVLAAATTTATASKVMIPAIKKATTMKPKAVSSGAKASKVTKTSKAPKVTKSPKPAKFTKPLVASASTTSGRWLLFVLVGLTISYIIYEFRHDLRNYYYKLRPNPVTGQEPGADGPGRRND